MFLFPHPNLYSNEVLATDSEQFEVFLFTSLTCVGVHFTSQLLLGCNEVIKFHAFIVNQGENNILYIRLMHYNHRENTT